jgi:hypothetical protein
VELCYPSTTFDMRYREIYLTSYTRQPCHTRTFPPSPNLEESVRLGGLNHLAPAPVDTKPLRFLIGQATTRKLYIVSPSTSTLLQQMHSHRTATGTITTRTINASSADRQQGSTFCFESLHANSGVVCATPQALKHV